MSVQEALRLVASQLTDMGVEPDLIRQRLAAAAVTLFARARGLDVPSGLAAVDAYTKHLLVGAATLPEWGEMEPATLGWVVTWSMSRTVRHRTGAEYTPRAYVERLALATYAPVYQRWDDTQRYAAAGLVTYQGRWRAVALDLVAEFHRWLCSLRVLDPACGTGNILYVCMGMLMEVEADVRRWLLWLDAPPADLLPRVTPGNFTGMDVNPHACEVASLVMWVSWHQARARLSLPELSNLPPLTVIQGDSVLAWDCVETRKHAQRGAA